DNETKTPANTLGFDVTAANQALNYLANKEGMDFDKDGAMAATGKVDTAILSALNKLPYFSQPAPKSLSNQFFTDTVRPIIDASTIATADKLSTVTEHIATQVAYAAGAVLMALPAEDRKILITGGGAHNKFLVE